MSRESGAPRRVLYCESNSDGTVGGSHRCLLNLIEGLDRSRYEPLAVFCEEHALMPRFRAAAPVFVSTGRPSVRWGSDKRSGVDRLWQPAAVLARRATNALLASMTVLDHVRFLREHRIDLIHLNNSISRHHALMVAARFTGAPVVCHERGLPVYGFSDRQFGRRVALIIPASQWIRARMLEQGVSPANIRVMYDGLDAESIAPAQSSDAVRRSWGLRMDQPVFGMIGNIRHWKGQETVVRALIDVIRRGHDVACVFVGAATEEDQDYLALLNRLISEAGIEANCRFTGYQSDVPSLIDAMDFIVHASVAPEPFGMVVLEAMAQHKAVIGARAGGVTEMVIDGETGLTFPSGDWRSLAAHIVTLLDDRALAARMGERGHHRVVTAFSLARYVADVQAAYDAALAGGPATAPDMKSGALSPFRGTSHRDS